jgi:hypothetical protein
LWDLYQSLHLDPAASAKALAMYNTLENIYLEPTRRKIYQMDSAALAGATANLQASTTDLNNTVNEITGVVNTVKQIDDYAKVFDTIISTAAKMLVAAG